MEECWWFGLVALCSFFHTLLKSMKSLHVHSLPSFVVFHSPNHHAASQHVFHTAEPHLQFPQSLHSQGKELVWKPGVQDACLLKALKNVAVKCYTQASTHQMLCK